MIKKRTRCMRLEKPARNLHESSLKANEIDAAVEIHFKGLSALKMTNVPFG